MLALGHLLYSQEKSEGKYALCSSTHTVHIHPQQPQHQPSYGVSHFPSMDALLELHTYVVNEFAYASECICVCVLCYTTVFPVGLIEFTNKNTHTHVFETCL